MDIHVPERVDAGAHLLGSVIDSVQQDDLIPHVFLAIFRKTYITIIGESVALGR